MLGCCEDKMNEEKTVGNRAWHMATTVKVFALITKY